MNVLLVEDDSPLAESIATAMRAQGWRPTVTNEQAYVEGTEAKWWTMITPKRRQELALGGMVAAVVALAVGGVWVTRWVRRRRARR